MSFPLNGLAPSAGGFDLLIPATREKWQKIKPKVMRDHFTAALGCKIEAYLKEHQAELNPTSAAILLFLRRKYQDSFGTIETYITNLCLFFNGVQIHFHLIQRTDIDDYLLQLKTRGQRISTINTKLSSIKSFFKFAAGEGWLRLDPAAAIESRRGKSLSGHHTKVLGLQDVQTVLNYARLHEPIRNYVILALGFFAGPRAIEVCRLKWKDLHHRFDHDGGKGKWYARVLGKGSREREIYLPGWLIDRIMLYRQVEYRVQPYTPAPALDEMPLFPNMRNTSKPIGPKALYPIFHRVGQLALGREISPHWGRHSFATNSRLKGATLEQVQAGLGHELLTTTQRYDHVLHLQKTAAGQVFDDMPDGQRPKES